MGKSKDLATGAAYVDASGDNVTGDLGIRNSNPARQLHIGASDNTNHDAVVVLNNGGALGYRAGIEWRYENVTSPRARISVNASYQDLEFDTANTKRMTIDASGRVTMPYQPAFLASNSTDVNFSNGSEWSANTAVYNTGNHYNTSTYKFTAPVSGYYIFGGMARFDGSGAASITYMHVYRKVNGVANHPGGILPGLSTVVYSGSGFSAFTWNDMVYLTANDSFNYDLYGGSTSTTILHNQSYWYGYLLG